MLSYLHTCGELTGSLSQVTAGSYTVRWILNADTDLHIIASIRVVYIEVKNIKSNNWVIGFLFPVFVIVHIKMSFFGWI